MLTVDHTMLTVYHHALPSQEGRYCPKAQPPTSAFREPSFGHGLLRVHNATHATWTWNRNQVLVCGMTDMQAP